MRLKYNDHKKEQIEAAEKLFNYCILYEYFPMEIYKIESAIRYLKADDPVKAYREFDQIRFYGIWSFTDWLPSAEVIKKNFNEPHVSFLQLVDDLLLAMSKMPEEVKKRVR